MLLLYLLMRYIIGQFRSTSEIFLCKLDSAYKIIQRTMYKISATAFLPQEMSRKGKDWGRVLFRFGARNWEIGRRILLTVFLSFCLNYAIFQTGNVHEFHSRNSRRRKKIRGGKAIRGVAGEQAKLFALLSCSIDPLGQPKVTAGRDHCFRTCCVRTYRYVRPSPLFKI